ncbi:hypothetical protein BX600DRAFT_517896 [Xylariales sp. PMI_506]|nr:hypothetical protein BX600DRAFT_517896 [Xylariales sp. PMI_506]
MEHLTAPWADVFAHPFPVAILAAYLLAAALLTWRSIAIIAQQASSKSRTARSSSSSSSSVLSGRPLVFALLAAASLGTTQYHLFSFFAQSYREWEEDQLAGAGAGAGAGALRLGSWLRDTKLFEQAWRSAMATESRFWWTQQIFCFAAGWSVLLGTEG